MMDKKAPYLQTIKNIYPGLDIYSARLHTTEGQFNDILLINEDLIFRFPRYQDGIKDFLQEIEILQKLQGYVTLPIPNPIYVSTDPKSVGKVFMGYQLLPGKPLFREALNAITDEATLDRFAYQLAAFLCGLHTLSSTALGLDLPIENRLAEYKKFFARINQHLFPFMRPDAQSLITGQFENYFNDTNLHDYIPTLIHGDFGGSNILFEQNSISGIIDFGFAAIGDPAVDIAAVSTFGESFFERICQHYPNIETLLKRARFYRSTFALYEALHGFRNKDQQAFESGMEQYV